LCSTGFIDTLQIKYDPSKKKKTV